MQKVFPAGWWVQAVSQPSTKSTVIPQASVAPQSCDWRTYCFQLGGGCAPGDTPVVAGYCVIKTPYPGCELWSARPCDDC